MTLWITLGYKIFQNDPARFCFYALGSQPPFKKPNCSPEENGHVERFLRMRCYMERPRKDKPLRCAGERSHLGDFIPGKFPADPTAGYNLIPIS